MNLKAFDKFRNRNRNQENLNELEHLASIINKMSDDEKEELFDAMGKIVSEAVQVSTHEWTETHPFDIKCGSDRYYADLVNRLSSALMKFKFPPNTPDGLIFEASMSAAAYLEDLVSGLGVWDAFRSLYRKTYGKWLPFYDCDHDDYLTDNVNIEDLKFLVWQTFCRLGQSVETVFSPYSQGVEIIAQTFFDILEEEYETAPEAVRLRDSITKILREGDLYKLKELAHWLRTNNKLLAAPDQREWEHILYEKVMDTEGLPDKTAVIYQVKCDNTWMECGPLGCLPSVYLAEMCRARKFEDTAAKLDTFRIIKNGYFEVLETDRKFLKVKDAAGTEYRIESDSFKNDSFPKDCKGYHASIMKYGDTWNLNGIGSFMKDTPFKDAETFEIGYVTPKAKDFYEDVVRRNKGRRIFYCRSQKEIADILGIGFRGEEKTGDDTPDNYVLMISPEVGIVVLADAAEYFKDSKNPFYNKSEAKEWAMQVVMNGIIPDDMAALIQEKKLLPDAQINTSQGKRLGKALVQDNLRFLIGFYRTVNPSLDDDTDDDEWNEYN